MKYSNKVNILAAVLACCVIKTSFADGLSTIGSSITNNAEQQIINAINLTLPFVVSDWGMLATYYNQNAAFPPAGAYAVDTSIITGVTSITNSSAGTLEITFAPTAPGPMAGKSFVLAPTRIERQGNIFYVYELAQCFTNISNSLTALNNPPLGTPISLFSNSNLGTNCVFSADPYSAATKEVQGNPTAPSSSPSGVSP
jgi:hypothetical protein